MPKTMNLMELLDVEGWAALCFVEDGKGGLIEDADARPTDRNVKRIEQWIVAGEQYIYTAEGSRPELGEFEEEPEEHETTRPLIAEDLFPLVRRALARGAKVHPVLLVALAIYNVDPNQFVGRHMDEGLRLSVMEAVEEQLRGFYKANQENGVGIDVIMDQLNSAFYVRPRISRPLRKIAITIVP